jgi:hypothetical protein
MNRVQLRNPTKHGEASILTSSYDSKDDDSYDSSDVELIVSKEGEAYNFDDLKEELLVSSQAMTMLPIPLPCIEPSMAYDFNDACDGSNENIAVDNTSNFRFRWSNIRSPFSLTKVSGQENWVENGDDTLTRFFMCGSQSDIMPMMTDSQYNSVEGFDDSDDTSLLRGYSVNKTSKFFKASVSNRPNHVSSTSVSIDPTSKSKGLHHSMEDDGEEQSAHLIADRNDECHDWIHRQLAFDLEYLEDNNPVTQTDDNFGANEEEANWALHPDDIAFEMPPPPPLQTRSLKSRSKVHEKYEPELRSELDILKDLDGYESQKFKGPTSLCESSTKENTFDLQEESWHPFDSDVRMSGKASRTKNYRKITPIVRGGRLGRYSCMNREIIQRQSRTSRHGRRRSRHRSPPTMLGRQFATNLSTVTERPSEEDASSCMLTPMSSKNRHFFATYDRGYSSSQSEGGTAETCNSSKDSHP